MSRKAFIEKITKEINTNGLIEDRISLPVSLVATPADQRDFNKVAGAFAEFIIADKYGFEMIGSGGSFPDLAHNQQKLHVEVKLGANPAFIRKLGKGEKTVYDVYKDKTKKYNKIKKKGHTLWLCWLQWKAQFKRPDQDELLENPEVPSWFYIKITSIKWFPLSKLFETDVWKSLNVKSLTTKQLFDKFKEKK